MRRFWIVAIAVLLLGAGLGLLAGRGRRGWTTSSPEALRELKLGLEASMKYYSRDAYEHCARALELDPDFVAAKLAVLMRTGEGEGRQRIIEELRTTELDPLSERERSLVRYALAYVDGPTEERNQILDAYLELHPHDPFALSISAEQAWAEQDWKSAEELYRRLLDADPNWVAAQNTLGYIALAQGEFAQAEERFETYMYIAPDQANPHDSLGELLLIVGRYEEARQNFEQALRIKPDFCGSYSHLFDLFVLQGQPQDIEPYLEEASDYCGSGAERLRCVMRLWTYYLSEDFGGAFSDDNQPCLERLGKADWLVHRMAALSGRDEVAVAAEQELARRIADSDADETMGLQHQRAMLLHMTGVRTAIDGDYAEAARLLRAADDEFYYWGAGQGILKLYNLLHLAVALEHSEDQKAAQSIVDKVRAVNPRFAEIYPGIGRLLRK